MRHFSRWAMFGATVVAAACITGCGDSETTDGSGGSPSTGGTGGTPVGPGGQGGETSASGGTGGIADGGSGGAGGSGGSGGMADICGDGVVGSSEECDDNNTAVDDGCDANCDVETGWECSGEPSTCNPDCGDGTIIAPETCDDSNEAPSDGCDDNCLVETGYVCVGEPSACTDGGCTLPHDITLTDNAGTLEGTFSGDTTGASNDVAEASCDGIDAGDGADVVHSFTLPDARDVTITTAFGTADGIVRVLTAACDPATGVPGEPQYGNACENGDSAGGDEVLELVAVPAGTYYLVVDGFAGDEGTYDIAISAAASNCGDGNITGLEECDDNNGTIDDGCTGCLVDPMTKCTGMPSVCTSSCQDGIVDFDVLEQCDDGNNANGDRCDDTCQLEFDVAESEPNDTVIDATTVIDGEAVFGAIDTFGDIDVYELTVTSTSYLRLELYETIDGDMTPGDSFGLLEPLVDCVSGGGDHPWIYVFDSTGDVAMTSDAFVSDTSDGDGNCPFVGANRDGINALVSPGTYYIRINSFLLASGLVPQYVLDVQLDEPLGVNDACDQAYNLCDPITPLYCDGTTNTCLPLCGNGVLDPGEECEDGNADDGDRCTNSCILTADVFDNGNNNTFGTAQPLANGEVARGSIDTVADPFDLYTFTLATPMWVAIEQYTFVDMDTGNYEGSGLDPTMDCDATQPDPDIRLFDTTGDPTDNATALIGDDLDGDGFCGYIGPGQDPGALLPAGTYYIKVHEFGDNGDLARYLLDLRMFAPLGQGDTCDVAHDLCDITQSLTCVASQCALTPPDPIDRANWEHFTAGDFDLDGTALTFSPFGGSYGVLADTAASLPDTPGAGDVATTALALIDDDAASYAFNFTYFGVAHTELFVSSNGFITFTAPSTATQGDPGVHFSLPRISAAFDDLNPVAGGTVTVDEYADRLTVTWDNVSEFSSVNVVNAQVQLFNTGEITITHSGTNITDGLVGLSAGDAAGTFPDELDFSAQTPVTPVAGDLVINEYLADPLDPGGDVDANCDSTADASDDQFVEIVNVSGVPLDLTGVTVADGVQVRHTFGSFVLPAGRAIVVYGGGAPACAEVTSVVASTGTLDLTIGTETITLSNAAAMTIDTVSFTMVTSGVSTTLSFDIVGAFTDHDIAGGSAGSPASPGFRVTGDAF